MSKNNNNCCDFNVDCLLEYNKDEFITTSDAISIKGVLIDDSNKQDNYVLTYLNNGGSPIVKYAKPTNANATWIKDILIDDSNKANDLVLTYNNNNGNPKLEYTRPKNAIATSLYDVDINNTNKDEGKTLVYTLENSKPELKYAYPTNADAVSIWGFPINGMSDVDNFEDGQVLGINKSGSLAEIVPIDPPSSSSSDAQSIKGVSIDDTNKSDNKVLTYRNNKLVYDFAKYADASKINGYNVDFASQIQPNEIHTLFAISNNTIKILPDYMVNANAVRINGKHVNSDNIGDNKILVYKTNGNEFVYEDLPTIDSSSGIGIKTLSSYGAVGDGTTDDTTAIQAALDDANYNIVLDGEGKKYKVTAYLYAKKDFQLKNAIIDASQANLGDSNTGIIEIGKDNFLGQAQAISGEFIKNNREFILKETPTDLSVGDWIAIRSNAYFDNANEAKIYQLAKIYSIDSANKKIKIVGKSFYDFKEADSAIIQKVDTIKFNIDNVEILSNNTDMCSGVRFFGAIDSNITNCYMHNLEYSAIALEESVNITIDNNIFIDITDSETGYGINIDDGAMNVRCVNNKGYNVRHLTTGGGNYVVTRITYDNNIAEAFDAGLDFHNGSNYVTITNNHITIMDRYDPSDQTNEVTGDAIIVQGTNAVIANNTCLGGRNGVYLQSFALDKHGKNVIANNIFDTCLCGIQAQAIYGDIIIANNSISNSWGSYNRLENEDVGYYGINIGNSTDNLAIDAQDVNIVVDGNLLENIYSPISFYIKRTNQKYNSIKISNNVAKTTIPDTSKEGDETFIYCEGMDTNNTSEVKMFIIDSNVSGEGYFVGLDYADIKANTLKVTGNTFYTASAKGYGIDIEKSFNNNYPLCIEVTNNTLIGDATATPSAIDIQTKLDTHAYYDGTFYICNNLMRGFKKGIDISDTYSNYVINNNDIVTYSSDGVGISLEAKVTTDYTQQVTITGNTMYNSGGNGNIGIDIETNTTDHLPKIDGRCIINGNNISKYTRGIYTYNNYSQIIINNNATENNNNTGITVELETNNCQLLSVCGNTVLAETDITNEAIRTQTNNGSKFENASFSGNVTKNFKYGIFAQDIDNGYERGTVFATSQTDAERVYKAGSTGANFKVDS